MQIYKLFITFYHSFLINIKVEGNEFYKFHLSAWGQSLVLLSIMIIKFSSYAADSAFEEANRLNNIFSDYIADSEISLLSQSSYTGNKVKLSDELFEVLRYSKSLAIKTNKLLIQPSDNYHDYGEYLVSEKVFRQKNL